MIRLTALGDVAITEPVVRALRAHAPDVAVDFVTDRRYAGFVEKYLGVDRAIGYDRRGEDAGMSGVARVADRIGSVHYDLILDLQGKLRTRALTKRVSATQRVTLEKRSFGKALLSLVGHDPPIHDRHSVDIYLSVLAQAQVPIDVPKRPRLQAPDRERRPVRRVGLSPGATHATKRWAPERFAALADRIGADEVVLIGGPADRPLLDAIRTQCKANIADVDVAAMDVLGLVDVLHGLDLLVSVDTGPAHLAAGLGVPTVVLFGPTSPVRWGPIGAEHRIVSLELDCAPCSNTGGAKCPVASKQHACMQDLTVDEVADAVNEASA